MSNPVVQKIVLLAVIFLGFAAALFFLAVPIDCSPVIQIPENPVPPNPKDQPIGMGGGRPAPKKPGKTPDSTAPAKSTSPAKDTAPAKDAPPTKDTPAKDTPPAKDGNEKK